jgi:hypothetical protein
MLRSGEELHLARRLLCSAWFALNYRRANGRAGGRRATPVLRACPDLNQVEGIWSLLRRKLTNTAFTDSDHLVSAIRHGPRETQHRPHLVVCVFAETGLTFTINEP